MPRCSMHAACCLKKSWSCVKMTRPVATQKAICSSSRAWSKPASAVLVTLTPWRRRPAAMAGSQCSSRWKRIVRDILALEPLQLLLEKRRGLRPQLLDEPMLVLDGGPDLVAVVVVVGEGRMHLGEGDRGVGGRNLGRRHPHLLVPDGHVPDLDAVAEDMWLPAAVAGAYPDVLRDHRQGRGLAVRLGLMRGNWFHKLHRSSDCPREPTPASVRPAMRSIRSRIRSRSAPGYSAWTFVILNQVNRARKTAGLELVP